MDITKITGMQKVRQISKNGFYVTILNSGDLREIKRDDIYVNLYLGNNLEGMLSNIFLRLDKDVNKVKPLIGIKSNSEFEISDDQICYRGEFDGEKYEVIFALNENAWFYTVKMHSNRYVELVYGQDIGLSAGIRGNEAYVSQYIDHKAFLIENGYIVCSRQNQKQGDKNPYLQIGCFDKTVAYSTDGFQFFGTDYKFDNKLLIQRQSSLPSEVYQYEFSYAGLQTRVFCPDEKINCTFYGIYVENHEEAIAKAEYRKEITNLFETIKFFKADTFTKLDLEIDFNNILECREIKFDEIRGNYKNIRNIETYNDITLSFFCENSTHVVLSQKERELERTCGAILISFKDNFINENQMATTVFFNGIFNSQIVCGNTSLNKYNSNVRNQINATKINGQRIFVKIDNEYKLLSVPSYFENGLNYVKWFYVLENDIIEITTFIATNKAVIQTEISSGKEYEFIITDQAIMNENEFLSDVNVDIRGNHAIFTPSEPALVKMKYPQFSFRLVCDAKDFSFKDTGLFFKDKIPHEGLFVIKANGNKVNLNISGGINGLADFKNLNFETEKQQYHLKIKEFVNNFELGIHVESDKIQKVYDFEVIEETSRINDIVYWYAQNALVHYLSPHGLEQYGGAAWGTRDVCQGPMELLLTFGKFDAAKDVLLKVFTHQYLQTGSWPQWFMFDRYSEIQQHESHGDVIVWPAFALAQYLQRTNDYLILDEKIPFTDINKFVETKEKYTLFEHVKKEISHIENNFIEGTHLSRYGDGDWDDTLQPANSKLRDTMISGWTTSLTYNMLDILAEQITIYDEKYAKHLSNLADYIKHDYHQYIIKDGITSGFILFNEKKIDYLLHPRDEKTGLKYRLLPMTRSMISEIFTKKEALNHYKLIKEHLYFSDGVRLMDNTCKYKGGEQTYFMRAETASNFGREIGLNYIHAHIRYIEAMAKIGENKEAWEALLKVNPIYITKSVTNACLRQSNAYFSSSDACFKTRYEAMDKFNELRNAKIPVKGGWRIYSSGPGIYINQLISHILGVKVVGKYLLINPALPEKMNNLVFNFIVNGKNVSFIYKISGICNVKEIKIDGRSIPFLKFDNKYKSPGCLIDLSEIKNDSVIEIKI